MALVRVLLALAMLLLTLPSAATPAVSLPERGVVPTGPDGLVATVGTAMTVELSPDARVWVERSMDLQLRPIGRKSRCHVLRLERGRVVATVPSGADLDESVLVRGPRKVSAVSKGGRLSFAAEPGHVTVAAVSGSALVAVGDDWRELGNGMARTVSDADRRGQPRPLLGAPELVLDEPLLFALDAPSTSARAKIRQVTGAVHYEIAVMRRKGETFESWRQFTSEGPEQALEALTPGEYSITSWAIDRHGTPGQSSDAVRLLVLGVEPPPGARVREGSLQIGTTQRVRLLGSEAFEMSYGDAETFVRAPDEVGLSRGRPVTLRFRQAGGGPERALRLEPRALRARVEISPRGATWPDSTVSVLIRLHDGSGRPVAAASQVSPTVTVNARPWAVRWSRQRSTLRARIPRARHDGPWIVRVEVRDELGDEIGRNFLEVARGRPRAPASSSR